MARDQKGVQRGDLGWQGLSGPGDDRGKPSGRLAHLYNESPPPFTGCHGNYTSTMLLSAMVGLFRIYWLIALSTFTVIFSESSNLLRSVFKLFKLGNSRLVTPKLSSLASWEEDLINWTLRLCNDGEVEDNFLLFDQKYGVLTHSNGIVWITVLLLLQTGSFL